MKTDMKELQVKALEAKELFKANSLGEISFKVKNPIQSKGKDKKEYKVVRLITQDKYNFQIIDGNYGELYYGRLNMALHKLFKLVNPYRKQSEEVKAYIESFKDIKPDMVNRNIDTKEIIERIK